MDKGVEIMEKVTFDYGKSAGFISQEEVSYMAKLAEDARQLLEIGRASCRERV